ncbi:MAG: iron-containing alcohol dehydrogenase [Burkholderiaceae bacterium]
MSTTLGGAEFSDFGGCTDPRRGIKDGYAGKTIGAATVILDPAITRHTPAWLWLSTGVRGLDHDRGALLGAVEPVGHRHLPAGAAVVQRGPAAHPGRSRRPGCPAAMPTGGLAGGLGILRVPYGASHGIGHSLGAVTGISHGYTSCIMLPHVMRYNLAQTRSQQQLIARALHGADPAAEAAEAADRIGALIASLGMPTRLADQGVEPAQHRKIADGALNNLWVRSNPRPITSADEIVALPQATW